MWYLDSVSLLHGLSAKLQNNTVQIDTVDGGQGRDSQKVLSKKLS